MYQGYDVHSYSKQWSLVATEHADLLQKPVGKMQWSQFLGEVTPYIKTTKAADALRQLDSGYQQGTDIDRDLSNLSVSRLCLETWALITEKGNVSDFLETLEEIHTTCLQGQSHRLFALWIALA